MIRIHVLVEGNSEESFVNEILAPHFWARDIYITVHRVTTRVDNRTGLVYRGGMSNFMKVERELKKLILEDTQRYLTTMFDLYAIPNDFPGYLEAFKKNSGIEKAATIEQSLEDHFDNYRFIPYLQVHEFEALLFSDVDRINDCLEIFHDVKNSNLSEVRQSFKTPEDINDDPSTAPSKRILSVYKAYEKITDGITIAEDIGLQTIRNECKHFNDWVTQLENLKPIH